MLKKGRRLFGGKNAQDLWCPPKRLPWMINEDITWIHGTPNGPMAVGPWGPTKTATGPFPSIAELEQMSVQGAQLDRIWGFVESGHLKG